MAKSAQPHPAIKSIRFTPTSLKCEVEIYGAVVMGSSVIGGDDLWTLLDEPVYFYSDDVRRKAGQGAYGVNDRGWCFAGDVGDEGDILIVVDGTEHCFYGKRALNQALALLRKVRTEQS